MDVGQNINGLFFMSNMDENDVSVVMVGLETLSKKTLIPDDFRSRCIEILNKYKKYMGVE